MIHRIHFQGKAFDSLENIKSKDIRIKDIAHSLSLQCRFNGHVPCFYSIAEHSILVMKMLASFSSTEMTSKLKLAALLHDGNEVYIGDITRPVRTWLHNQCPRGIYGTLSLSWLSHHFTKIVYEKFQISLTNLEAQAINTADNFMLEIEGIKFFKETWETSKELRCIAQEWINRIHCYSPERIERIFLEEFENVYQSYVAERRMVTETSSR